MQHPQYAPVFSSVALVINDFTSKSSWKQMTCERAEVTCGVPSESTEGGTGPGRALRPSVALLADMSGGAGMRPLAQTTSSQRTGGIANPSRAQATWSRGTGPGVERCQAQAGQACRQMGSA